MFILLTLIACDGKPPTGDDTSSTGECDTTNEECRIGTCGGEGANMLPGSDCLACHVGGDDRRAVSIDDEDEDEPGPLFGIGGTAFTDGEGSGPLSGATVRVTDADGTTVTLTTNSVGNFYSERSLTPPLSAEIEVDGEVRRMATTVATGGCNSCHTCDGPAGGKLTGP